MTESFKENFLLTLLPVFSFIGAYIFEAGYASAYGYDPYFIQLDLKLIVVGLIIVLVLLWPVAFLVFIMVSLIKKYGRRGRGVALCVLPLLLAILFNLAVGLRSSIAKFLIGLTVFFILYEAAALLFRVRTYGWGKAFDELAKSHGVSEQKPADDDSKKKSLPEIVYGMQAWVMVTFILCLCILIIRGAGVGAAVLKETYSVVSIESKEYAVVAVYGDSMVLAGITEEKHDGRITILHRSANPALEIKEARLKEFLSERTMFLY